MMTKECESIINEYIDDLKETIPKDDLERDELIEALRDYLNNVVEYFLGNEDEGTEKMAKKEKAAKARLNFNIKYFKNMNTADLKSMLLKDEALASIKAQSNSFFRLAQQRLNGESIEVKLNRRKWKKEAKEMIKKLKEVKPYNLKTAKEYISEGMLDLNYAIDPNSKETSVRLWMVIENQKDKEEEEER